VTRRFHLTDGQWAVLEPLLSERKKLGGTTEVEQAATRRRDQVAVTHRGAMAGRAGLLGTLAFGVWGLCRRWQRDGTWARVLAALQDQAARAGLISRDVSVDSAFARAYSVRLRRPQASESAGRTAERTGW
jgi:transposase